MVKSAKKFQQLLYKMRLKIIKEQNPKSQTSEQRKYSILEQVDFNDKYTYFSDKERAKESVISIIINNYKP